MAHFIAEVELSIPMSAKRAPDCQLGECRRAGDRSPSVLIDDMSIVAEV